MLFYQLFIQSAINSFWTMINLLQKPSIVNFLVLFILPSWIIIYGHLQTRRRHQFLNILRYHVVVHSISKEYLYIAKFHSLRVEFKLEKKKKVYNTIKENQFSEEQIYMKLYHICLKNHNTECLANQVRPWILTTILFAPSRASNVTWFTFADNSSLFLV